MAPRRPLATLPMATALACGQLHVARFWAVLLLSGMSGLGV